MVRRGTAVEVTGWPEVGSLEILSRDLRVVQQRDNSRAFAGARMKMILIEFRSRIEIKGSCQIQDRFLKKELKEFDLELTRGVREEVQR